VTLVEPQLGGILDRHDPIGVRNRGRDRVQERRLPGSGTAGDHDVELRPDAALDELHDLGIQRPELDQVMHGQPSP
jgi:hypothetical protein